MSQFSELQLFSSFQKLENEAQKLNQALIAHENDLSLPHDGGTVERLERILFAYQMRSHYSHQ